MTPAHLATVEEAIGDDEDESLKSAWERGERRKLAARVITRTAVTAASTIGAILAPGFGRVMAFMGCFASFMIAIILPVSRAQVIRACMLMVDMFLPGSGSGLRHCRSRVGFLETTTRVVVAVGDDQRVPRSCGHNLGSASRRGVTRVERVPAILVREMRWQVGLMIDK